MNLMRLRIVLLLGISVMAASASPQKEKKDRAFSPVLKVLPVGSNLQNFSVPNYDENLKPSSLLKAGMMRVISDQQLTAEDVEVTLFSSEGDVTSQLNLKTADYDETRGLLRATEEVNYSSDNPRVMAMGTGAYFLLDDRMAFVEGPIEALITKSTPQKETSSFLKSSQGVLALFLSPQMLSSSLKVTTEEWGFIEGMEKPTVPIEASLLTAMDQKILKKAAQGSAKDLASVSQETEKEWREVESAVKSVEQSKSLFLKKVGKKDLFTIATQESSQPKEEKEKAERSPEGDKKGKDEVRVTCEGGMFTNTEKGQAVFLKNVKFEDNQGTMTCSKELKIFFSKKKAKEVKKTQGPVPAIGKIKVDDIEQIVGTGKVKIILNGKDGEPPLEATAETVFYNVKDGTIILKGGFPTIFQKGKIGMEAKEPNLYIKLGENFFASPGKWNTDFVPDFKNK